MNKKRISLVLLFITLLTLTACGKSTKAAAPSSSKKVVQSSSKKASGEFTVEELEKYMMSLGYKKSSVEADYLQGNKKNMIFMENPESVTLFFQYAESSEDEKNPDMILDLIKVRNKAEIDFVKVNKNLLDSHSNWLKGYSGVPDLLKKAKQGQWIMEVEKGDQTPVLLTDLKQISQALDKLN